MNAPSPEWTDLLAEQQDWRWRNQLRARLDGLADDEYFWEPAANAWSLRPRGTSTAPIQGGSGAFVIEFAFPEPDPAPMTTIAWRLGHVIVGVLGARVAAHFDGPPVDYLGFEYAATAAEAVDGRGAGPRTGRVGRAVRAGGGTLRRPADGRARVAHQPGDASPRCGDRPAARPVPPPRLKAGEP